MNARFLHIINSPKPVLVDFYADWCITCKEVPPVLKKVKNEFKQVRIVKVDVDKNPIIATYFKIYRLPTLIFFRKGKLLWKGEGLVIEEELKSVLSRQMNDSQDVN